MVRSYGRCNKQQNNGPDAIGSTCSDLVGHFAHREEAMPCPNNQISDSIAQKHDFLIFALGCVPTNFDHGFAVMI